MDFYDDDESMGQPYPEDMKEYTKGENQIGVIPVCRICGKVDATEGDGHDCFQHIQNEEMMEHYD